MTEDRDILPLELNPTTEELFPNPDEGPLPLTVDSFIPPKSS